MDGNRFDALTRMLGATATRRTGIAAMAAALLGVAPTVADARPVRRRVVCRSLGVGCTRADQCCSGVCDTRRTAPRSVRNRCGCADGKTACGAVCCEADQECDGGICLCDQQSCFVGLHGNAVPRDEASCYAIDDARLCSSDADCPCPPGSTCFCAKGESSGTILFPWAASVCVVAAPRPADNNGCCGFEEYCDVFYVGVMCVDVTRDRWNCGACNTWCNLGRVCENEACACHHDWCDHYCASDDAQYNCAELQSGAIIENCAGAIGPGQSPIACDSDDDCVDHQPEGAVAGGCVKMGFNDKAPLSYYNISDGGYCFWFTQTDIEVCD